MVVQVKTVTKASLVWAAVALVVSGCSGTAQTSSTESLT